MASVAHQSQGSYAPSRPSWKRRINLIPSLAACCKVRRMDANLLKYSSCLCVETTAIHASKRKSFRISSFEGSMQSDGYRDRVRRTTSGKSCFILSYISQDNEDTFSRLPKVHARSTSNADVTTTGSLAIHNLFKSWLTFLPMASRNEDETLEGPSSNEMAETGDKFLKGGILKTVWCKFWGMDATIKTLLVLFIPLFLTVNMKYGVEVAKELTPLWVGGPLLVALYIKMLEVICSLYVSSFKKSIKVVNNFTHGNMKEVDLWQHVVYFRNLDYKDESKRVWRWVGDKSLDYVESMWSCRKTIGLLKMVKIM